MKPLKTLLALLLALSAPLHAQPWPLDKVASLTDISWREGLHVSPDGRWLAYTVELPDTVDQIGEYAPSELTLDAATHRHQARLTNLSSGETLVLGSQSAYSWGTSFSPGGDRIAFYSDQNGPIQLYLYSLESREAKPISGLRPAMNFSFERPRWSPDGELVVVPCQQDEASPGAGSQASVEVLSTRDTESIQSAPNWFRARLAPWKT